MKQIVYAERLEQVRAYMHQHLDDELDLATLAAIACLSPFHWHRIYQAFYGETAATTVKRLRMHRAAGYLAQTSMPVHQIAVSTGYPNLQSFTRIFRDVYKVPPAAYRLSGNHVPFLTPEHTLPAGDYAIDVRDRPEMIVYAADHVGSYMAIAEAFDRVYGWLIAEGVELNGLRHIGVFHDDPFTIAEDHLQSQAGVVFPVPKPVRPPLRSVVIPACRCAVLRYRGPYAGMRAAYRWLYGSWLVESGYDLADLPLVEEYLNSPASTDPADLLTDISMPLRATM